MMRLLAVILGAMAFASVAVAIEIKRGDETPIIAQLLHNPGDYANKQVTIYGLIIERPEKSVFILQDVSQRPLKIVAKHGVKISVGDQVTVRGTLAMGRSGPHFIARSLTATRVLGGGGCC